MLMIQNNVNIFINNERLYLLVQVSLSRKKRTLNSKKITIFQKNTHFWVLTYIKQRLKFTFKFILKHEENPPL